MKLLFDQHLSHKLIQRLDNLYPGSSHIRFEGLSTEDDYPIWEFAQNHHFTIVTKDADFFEIGLLKGHPPKVVWLRCGNTSTGHIEHILRDNYIFINDFIQSSPRFCLELQ